MSLWVDSLPPLLCGFWGWKLGPQAYTANHFCLFNHLSCSQTFIYFNNFHLWLIECGTGRDGGLTTTLEQGLTLRVLWMS